MRKTILDFASDTSGASAIEYGLLAALVGVGLVAGLGTLRDALNNEFETFGNKINEPIKP